MLKILNMGHGLIGFIMFMVVAAAAAEQSQPAQTQQVQMRGVAGQAHGTVSLQQTAKGVLLTAALKNLPAGTHGFHLHQNAACTPSFKAAGGHFNPTGKAHGFHAPDGPHIGDMPNIHVPASGDLTIEIFLSALSLDPTAMPGTVMIHHGADDYISQPSGAAGSRIACGEINLN